MRNSATCGQLVSEVVARKDNAKRKIIQLGLRSNLDGSSENVIKYFFRFLKDCPISSVCFTVVHWIVKSATTNGVTEGFFREGWPLKPILVLRVSICRPQTLR